jgi:glycosyltransferase involved in cell wall biosynthesis
MRIGIDAKWYYGGPPSGVRVLQNLVDELCKSNKENEFVIFLDKKFENQSFPFRQATNVTLEFLWAENNLISNIFLLPRKASKHKLDVMVFQNFLSPFYRGFKVVYIFDVLFKSHPHFFTLKERIYFSPIKLLTAWFANGVITLSEVEKQRIARFGFLEEEKIQAVHIGIEKNFKPLKDQLETNVNAVKVKYQLPDRFLLYVGRLNSRKNIENIIRALPNLIDKEIPLIIAGKEDWKHGNYKALAENLGVLPRITFTGWTEDHELPIIYSLATLFCFPSYAEGFGLPPLEAMASGVPVIVSFTTSLPEICGEAAMYVDPEDPRQTAEAINLLMLDSDLFEKRKRQGIEHAAKFIWEKTAFDFVVALQKLKK